MWPWTKRHELHGAHARKTAAERLAQQEAKWPEVVEVSTSLRDLRKRNHFAQQLELIFRGDNK